MQFASQLPQRRHSHSRYVGTRLQVASQKQLHSSMQDWQLSFGRAGQVSMTTDVNVEVPITKLDSTTFDAAINATRKLAVVKFFAPWCRACKSIALEYKKTATSYKADADFFEVDISKSKDLCKSKQAIMIPSIQFYIPGMGCVDRFQLSARGRGKLNKKLDAFLGSASIEELRALDPTVLNPLVRFKQLMGAIEAIQKAPNYLQGKSMVPMLSEEQQEDIKRLFHWLDINGDGVIDQEELEVARQTLLSTGCNLDTADFKSDEVYSTVVAANDDSMLDETTFLRIMAKRITEEIKNADTLHDTFRAIDKDGNGFIEVAELVEAVKNISSALRENDTDFVAATEESVEQLFKGFDIDDSQLIDYEEFVNMVVGRA